MRRAVDRVLCADATAFGLRRRISQQTNPTFRGDVASPGKVWGIPVIISAVDLRER